MMLGKMTCSRPPARRPKFRPLESHGRPHSFLSYLTASLGSFCSCLGWPLPWGLQGFFPVFQDWAAITQAGGFGSQLPIHPKKKKKAKLSYPKPIAAFSPAEAVFLWSSDSTRSWEWQSPASKPSVVLRSIAGDRSTAVTPCRAQAQPSELTAAPLLRERCIWSTIRSQHNTIWPRGSPQQTFTSSKNGPLALETLQHTQNLRKKKKK